jgi:hypothetical protein
VRSARSAAMRAPIHGDESGEEASFAEHQASSSELTHIDDETRAELIQSVESLTADSSDVDLNVDERALDDAVNAFKLRVEKYREQSMLLDPMLSSVIEPLMSRVLERVALENAYDGETEKERRTRRRLHRCCEALDTLSSVRGWKVCVRFYPNDAKHLEPAVRLLSRSRGLVEFGWSTQRVFLCWLSILALTPFDLVSIDSAVDAAEQQIPNVVKELVHECKHCLGEPGVTRDAAAVTLAKLLTRPDMSPGRTAFVEWSIKALQGDVRDSGAETFLIPGVLKALSAIYKTGTREALLKDAENMWSITERIFHSEHAASSTLVRQLSVKLATRVGLVFMKPQVIAWRYDRGARCLQDNLGKSSAINAQEHLLHSSTHGNAPSEAGVNDNEENIVDVHRAIDDIVELFLVGLRDVDTVVRWSSAKGIGRIASRLPRDFADEIVEAVLDCLSVTESDSTWHGACLALAELSRRGLLLLDRLQEAIPRVVQALTYDVRRASHSIGAHVRDAAAYVCWAFARAYTPEIIEPHVHELAPALLMVCCFDREVNCRRAASAAFQENVGRIGRFPHGIDIVTTADYFSLGSMANAYLFVAPSICQFDEYRRHMLDHILDVKLMHWEVSTRLLAVKAIGKIGFMDPTWVTDIGLPTVIARVDSSDLPTRHGAMSAIGEMMLVIKHSGVELGQHNRTQIAELVQTVSRANTYAGTGGELMRSATCRFAECLYRTIEIHGIEADGFLDVLEDNLQRSNVNAQHAACSALSALCSNWKSADELRTGVERVVKYHTEIVNDTTRGVSRRGSALFLGVLPMEFLFTVTATSPAWVIVFNALVNATRPEENEEQRDAETRVNAILSLAEVAVSILENTSSSDGVVARRISSQVVDAALACMRDYSTDNRGDVGSWVREAAMRVIPILISALQRHSALEHRQVVAIVGAVLKQAVEKIDRVRALALQTLSLLIHGGSSYVWEPRLGFDGQLQALVYIPGYDLLMKRVPSRAIEAANASRIVSIFNTLSELLFEPAYAHPLLSGWILSAGAVGGSLVKYSMAALTESMTNHDDLINTFVDSAIQMLKDHKQDDRVTNPLLKVLEALILEGYIDQAHAMAFPVVELIRSECFRSRDIVKMITAGACLSHFVGGESKVHESALTGLLALMANRYPRVRCAAAEYLHLALSSQRALKNGESAVVQLLLCNAWDSPTHVTKATRKKMYEALELDIPSFMLKDTKTARVVAVDENASYAALVGSMGY